MPAVRSNSKGSRQRRLINNHPVPPRLPSRGVDKVGKADVRSVEENFGGEDLGRPFKSYYNLEAKREREFLFGPDPSIPIPKDRRPPPLTLRDLECIKTLGRSNCQVLLVRSKRKSHQLDKERLYALKAIPRRTCRMEAVALAHENAKRPTGNKQPPEQYILEHMTTRKSEISGLVEIGWHPFVSNILETFHDSQNVYLGLEYVPGGVLRSLIQKAPNGMKPADAAFYFGNIVCALEYLHSLQLVHRDLKPENILVGLDGYLCLTDFGACQPFDEVGCSHEGTEFYIAPEGYNEHQKTFVPAAFDWWACGCILFEMATGKMAFYRDEDTSPIGHPTHLENGDEERDIMFPPGAKLGKKLSNIVRRLLDKDCSKRLGSEGIQTVQSDPWLANVDWSKMRNRQYVPPFTPKPVNASRLWHNNWLPEQSQVPGLKIVKPPVHLSNDDRFPDYLRTK